MSFNPPPAPQQEKIVPKCKHCKREYTGEYYRDDSGFLFLGGLCECAKANLHLYLYPDWRPASLSDEAFPPETESREWMDMGDNTELPILSCYRWYPILKKWSGATGIRPAEGKKTVKEIDEAFKTQGGLHRVLLIKSVTEGQEVLTQ